MGLARDLADEFRGHFRIGAGAQMLARVDEARADGIGVDERAVMRKRNEHFVDGGDVRLRRFPRPAATCGISCMPDRHEPFKRRKTCVTRPKSLATITVSPSPTAMPALS